MGDREKNERSMLGDAPKTGAPDDDSGKLLERCSTERDQLSGHETADCAGAALADEYENEEDGGS